MKNTNLNYCISKQVTMKGVVIINIRRPKCYEIPLCHLAP